MERLLSICSLSALHLGLGGDAPPKQSTSDMKHSPPLRGEKRFNVFLNGFNINKRRKVSEIERSLKVKI
jgi:hypothetical protein